MSSGGPRKHREVRPLGLGEALLPIGVMMALFVVGVAFLEFNAELLVAVLIGAAVVAGIVAVRHGRSWDDIQRSTGEKLAEVLPAILILLVIGALISSWVLSGTIPFMVYWGVRLVEPRHLVITAFLSTAVMSLFTGTSWGSAGTIGVALMGTAAALQAPLAATAGAVVSGAYLGDKMSPLSDSTNISAIGADALLFAHIRHMVYTATPSFVLCLLVYGAFAGGGAGSGGGPPAGALTLLDDLDRAFSLHWIVLLPAVVVVWSIVRRVPPALAIGLSCLVALVIGVVVQGFGTQEALVAAVAGFRADMLGAAGVDPAAMGEQFLTLVERGGLYSMAPTLIVVVSAFLLAAGMDVSGALELIIHRMLAAVRSVFGLVAATMTAGGTMIALTSHGGVTALVIGGLFQKAYRERGLATVNLSRSIEDSVTITEPLMPWTVSAVYMAGTLGVPTLAYAPWAVFCYGGPVFSLLIAGLYRWTGFGIRLEEGTGDDGGSREGAGGATDANPLEVESAAEGFTSLGG
ncbi:MAG TPA: Na+/H+ antiporter NhaC [Longimicrobiales bacterium]|nr:Na+/H+ antiporter NhaC [Longimicrobiales bacterium]